MAQVHVIIGEDDFPVSEAVKRIVGDGIGLETVGSASSTNAGILTSDCICRDSGIMRMTEEGML